MDQKLIVEKLILNLKNEHDPFKMELVNKVIILTFIII
jgi:hypothetical protein